LAHSEHNFERLISYQKISLFNYLSIALLKLKPEFIPVPTDRYWFAFENYLLAFSAYWTKRHADLFLIEVVL